MTTPKGGRDGRVQNIGTPLQKCQEMTIYNTLPWRHLWKPWHCRWLVQIVRLELPIEGPLADPELFRRTPAVAPELLEGSNDSCLLDLRHRHAGTIEDLVRL